jgi:hypothetical protein
LGQTLNFENLNCACEAESASRTAACDIVCSPPMSHTLQVSTKE